MSDTKENSQENNSTGATGDKIDLTRRRLAGASSGILLTLASKPVLAGGSQACSISGHLSGGSLATQQTCTKCGGGTDFWKDKTWCKEHEFHEYFNNKCEDYKDSTYKQKCSWVLNPCYDNYTPPTTTSDYTKGYGDGSGDCTKSGSSWSGSTSGSSWSGSTSGSSWSGSSGGSYSDGYSAGKKKAEGDCSNYSFKNGYTGGYRKGYGDRAGTTPTNYQKGYLDGYREACKRAYDQQSRCVSGNWELARECLVSILNCTQPCVDNYGAKPTEIKEMWEQCSRSGRYEVKQGVYWSTSDCLFYLKGLHS